MEAQCWLKIGELAQRVGISPRTIRYYIQRGLLPSPLFRGRDTRYSEAHLKRLLAIKRLQQSMWSLDAIAEWLQFASDEEIHAVGSGSTPPKAPRPPAEHLARAKDAPATQGKNPVSSHPGHARELEPEIHPRKVVRLELLEGIVIEVPETHWGTMELAIPLLRIWIQSWLEAQNRLCSHPHSMPPHHSSPNGCAK
ncbi:MAG: MerR family transcriptional regulator [Sandaracinaceae bacterium]|nr:MerR family transcriptional regulator [Sandaracinaceae bacterium]